MSFPTLWQILSYHHVGVLLGPLLLGLGVVNLGWLLRAWRRGRREGAAFSYRPAIFAVFALVVGSAYFLSVYGPLWNAWRARADAGRIAEISVERLATEGQRPVGESLVIGDRKSIAEGFARLRTAEGRPRRRGEVFSDGYRIRLRLDGEAEYSARYLSVYRTSGRDRRIAVVIPHPGPDHAGGLRHGGEYDCPAFLDWVDQVAAPHFERR